jgi:phosphoglycolate phosphatase
VPGGHLIFDLDGTISDPSVGIWRSINYALTSFDYASVPEDSISAYIGPPIDVTFRELTQSESEEHILTLVAKFRERYADIGYSENSLYPGIDDAIGKLVEAGARIGLCTSKRVDFAEQILSMFGLRSHFQFVSGGDVGVTKAAQLAELLTAGLATPGSTMIGDRAIDILAGKANSLRSVGVLWGHGSEGELVTAGADQVLSDPWELGVLVNAV